MTDTVDDTEAANVYEDVKTFGKVGESCWGIVLT